MNKECLKKKTKRRKEKKRECKEAALGQQQVGINWAKTSPRHLPLTAISFLVCTWANICQQNTNLHRKKHLITWSHPPREKEWRLRWQAAFAIVAMVSLTSDKEWRRNNSPGKLRDFGESWSASDRSCTLSARNWNQWTACLLLFQPTCSLFQYTSSFIIQTSNMLSVVPIDWNSIIIVFTGNNVYCPPNQHAYLSTGNSVKHKRL